MSMQFLNLVFVKDNTNYTGIQEWLSSWIARIDGVKG